MATSNEPTVTRHERVRQILELAAGESQADYDGHPTFWSLPVEELVRVTIYGVPLIAPLEQSQCDPGPPACPPGLEVVQVGVTKSCCCATAEEGKSGKGDAPVKASDPPMAGRGAASALIKGLRGQCPFDGSRFPPLPWGGIRVADEDIAFIEEWIDDGCPTDDRMVALPNTSGLAESAVANDDGLAEYRVYAMPTSEFKYKSGELKQRVNIACMDPLQIEKLRYAHRELYRLNDFVEDSRNYNNVALIHQNHCQHAWERFLPWHRVYLYHFEQALQDFCPDVTLPYWDWTLPIYHGGKNVRTGPYSQQGGQIPEPYRAYLTEESIAYLASLPNEKFDAEFRPEVLDKLRALVCLKYNSQHLFFEDVIAQTGNPKFAESPYREPLIWVLLQANALWYPLRYPAEFFNDGEPSTINDVIHYHYPTADYIRQIQSLGNYREYGGGSVYNDSYGYLDQNPHNTIHIWSGGENPDFNPKNPKTPDAVQVAGRDWHKKSDLFGQPKYGDMFSNLTASFDPIFWPHHVNIDRLWSEWQVDNPNAVPSDLTATLTPWNFAIKDVLDVNAFGYEYVKGCYVFAVDGGSTVTRFVSGQANVPEYVLRNHRRVEIRLHRVPQLPVSCYIRAFLNQRDANANTSVDPAENPNYAGFAAVFGHGPCYGGPGHCDVPPLEPRRFDRRGRRHNTPRNFRIDATDCVRKLVSEHGAKDLQVTLVVVGVDGKEKPELLRMEGVSVNFQD